MLKLSLEKAPVVKVQPYFEIKYWNRPEVGMDTYSLKELKTNDIEFVKSYLTHLFLLINKIKTKSIDIKDLLIVDTQNNNYEVYRKYFYAPSNEVEIEVVVKNKNIVNIEFDYAKYYDEYGVEYNIKIEEVSKLIENF